MGQSKKYNTRCASEKPSAKTEIGNAPRVHAFTLTMRSLFTVSALAVLLVLTAVHAQIGNSGVALPLYSGNALTQPFNSVFGPQTQFLFFDNASAPYYNTSLVLVDGITDGIQILSNVGAVLIHLQATVQFAASWSDVSIAPLFLTWQLDNATITQVPATNIGVPSTFICYRHFSYFLQAGQQLRLLATILRERSPDVQQPLCIDRPF